MADETANENAVFSLIDRLKDSSEQVFNELSQRLLENPTFPAARRRSIEAKDRVGRTISGTMDFVNLPSKNDVSAIMESIEHLGMRLSSQQRALAAVEKRLDEIKTILDAMSEGRGTAEE